MARRVTIQAVVPDEMWDDGPQGPLTEEADMALMLALSGLGFGDVDLWDADDDYR